MRETASAGGPRWFHQLQFLAAVPMPLDYVHELGTTVNGMWASPDVQRSEVTSAHEEGRRVLFSVPMVALVPSVWQAPETAVLLDEVCLDIDGRPAQVGWYYWEAETVYAACVFSDPFRAYLHRMCESGIGAGADVVNLDEINTSVGLMGRKPGQPGFCHRCLERFRHAAGGGEPLADLDDDGLRDRLRHDDRLYARYRTCLEDEAFATVAAFIEDIRSHAARVGADFAVTANLAYLGNHVGLNGRLWGASWGSLVDFAMLENTYQLSPRDRSPHLLLPRGTFAPWYRLGTAATGAPVWICPSIMVPRQFDRDKRTTYYLMMFLEAYVNGGRWGYFWWPGVDDATRLEFTVPESVRQYTDLITAHRRHYEGPHERNPLAVLYLESCVLDRPEWHFEFIALAQALSEAGYQYDVVFSGDGGLASDAIPADALEPYQAVLAPDLVGATESQRTVIAEYVAQGSGQVVEFGGLVSATTPSKPVLASLWSEHGAAERDRVLDQVPAIVGVRVVTSSPLVRAVRHEADSQTALHLLNYDYRPETDRVEPATGVVVELHRAEPTRTITMHTLGGAVDVPASYSEGTLRFTLETLEEYALVVLE